MRILRVVDTDNTATDLDLDSMEKLSWFPNITTAIFAGQEYKWKGNGIFKDIVRTHKNKEQYYECDDDIVVVYV